MPRSKLLILLFTLLMILLGTQLVLAQSIFKDCLPECYASNDTGTGGDGKITWPFLAIDQAAMNNLGDQFGDAIANSAYNAGAFFATLCDPTCNTVRYTYNRDGNVIATYKSAGVPWVGVPIPTSYILIGLTILSLLLIGFGLLLYRKNRKMQPLKTHQSA